jgi:hypothetical protein
MTDKPKDVRVYVVEDTRERQTVSLSIDLIKGGKGGFGYRPSEAVMPTRNLRELENSLREFRRLKRKYELLREWAKVFEEAEKVEAAYKAAFAAVPAPPKRSVFKPRQRGASDGHD